MTVGHPPSNSSGTAAEIDALVQGAERAYAAHALKEASAQLEQALSLDRNHARANWLAGNIAQDDGALERAISRYRRALKAAPGFIEAMNDLGTAYHAKGWHADAEQCFRDAVDADPLHAAAMENLAAAVRAQGRYGEARNLFLRVLTIRIRLGLSKMFGLRRSDSNQARAPVPEARESVSKARALLKAGRRSEAKALVEQNASRHPLEPALHHLLGVIELGEGRADSALPGLLKAVELRSSVPEYQVDLGTAYVALKQYGKALECFQLALALDPDYAAAAGNIAKVLYDLGHYKQAENVYRDSVAMDPDFAVLRSNLAATLIALGKHSEALPIARTAIKADPASVVARVVLGRALLDTGELEEAFAVLSEAQRLAPRNGEVQRALAEYWINGPGDIGKANEHLGRALDVNPLDLKSRMLRSYVLIQQGQLAEGFAAYETRKDLPERRTNYTMLPYPFWDGSPLDGRGIVIAAEQGLGDEIMFATCIPDLRKQTSRIALLCSRRLEALFRRSFPDIEIFGGSHVSADDRYPVPPGYDLQIAAGSLPHYFRNRLEDFPARPAFLRPSEPRVRHWRERLADLGSAPKVGISWRGGTPLTGRLRRTLDLRDLDPLLRTPGVNWVSIQYGRCAEEIDEARRRLPGIGIAHWQEAVDDLDETAALMSSLDLCISVCNTQIHIAGGLGLDAWILAPKMPDWRYGMSGDRMLWYPTARMFRQETAGDWSGPLRSLTEAVRRRFPS